MIGCRELIELLNDFLSDELPGEQRHLIEQHLGHCQRCCVFVETYRLTIRISRQLPDAPLPPSLVARLEIVLKQVREEPPGET